MVTTYAGTATARDGADPLAGEPAVAALRELLPGLVAGAAQTERSGVTRDQCDRLAAAGLYGVDGPPGDPGVPPPVSRRVAELLAGADPQVWFVWFQHHAVVRLLRTSDNAALVERWMGPLCRGESYAGVAFSHLRGSRPLVSAERVDGGWLVSGRQPWCTGWGILDVVLLGAVDRDGDVLFAVIPAEPSRTLRATGELPLSVMEATHTVALELTEHRVSDDQIAVRMPYSEWLAADRLRNANVQASTFGVALAAIGELAVRAPEAAARLTDRLGPVRAEAYRLLDDVPPGEQVERRLALRAVALLLAQEAAVALVVATGGSALGLGQRGGQLLRAAAFQLVHSQDLPVREATLAHVAVAG